MPGADFSHANDVMRRGYRQNTYGWEKFLMTSPRLQQIQFQIGNRIAGVYRVKQRRGREPGQHTANQIRVSQAKAPGGRKGDRMETMITAYGRGAVADEFGQKRKGGNKRQRNLRGSLVYVSGGKVISPKGRVSG